MKQDNSMMHFSPQFAGIFMVAFGIFILILAIWNPEWFFGESYTFNLQKVQGWIRFFGRNTTRFIMVIMAVFLIAFGLFWIWTYR